MVIYLGMFSRVYKSGWLGGWWWLMAWFASRVKTWSFRSPMQITYMHKNLITFLRNVATKIKPQPSISFRKRLRTLPRGFIFADTMTHSYALFSWIIVNADMENNRGIAATRSTPSAETTRPAFWHIGKYVLCTLFCTKFLSPTRPRRAAKYDLQFRFSD